MFVNLEACSRCESKACLQGCVAGGVRVAAGQVSFDRSMCRRRYPCGWTCAKWCQEDAIEVVGRRMAAGEVINYVLKDWPFYEASGGGMTVSGGEPLAQPRFTEALLKLAKQAGLHTVLDTCGYAAWDVVQRVLPYVDVVLYDIKHADTVAHRAATGVGLERIVENARRICREGRRVVVVRVPVVRGFNDAPESLAEIAELVAGLGRIERVELLPYHHWGEWKYERLGRRAVTSREVEAGIVEEARRIFARRGVTAEVGG